jgi:glucose-1-phosphate adenylyltransferase
MSQTRQADQNSDRFISTLTKNTVAMILAGGRGSRLKSLTDWRAKPAVQFGGKFRIIDFPLSNCVNSGIRRINVATQYKAQSLIQHIQRGWGFLRGEFNEYVNIIPAQQRISEEWYKGTADAVYQNIDILREGGAEYVLILAGDHIYKMDYGKMLATHVRNNADMTVACINVPLEDAKGFGVLAVDDTDRVVEFAEKPANPKHMPGDPTKAFASMGIYVFNAKFLYEQLIRDAGDSKSSHDFGGDIIPYIIKKYKIKTLDGEQVILTPKPYNKGVIIGGLIFGLGWAITGACPGPLFAQIGSGYTVIIVTFLSAVAGTWVYGYFQDKLPH